MRARDKPLFECKPVRLTTARSYYFDPPSEQGQLSAQGSLHRLIYPDGHLGWLVTSHSLASAMLADRRFSARSELKRAPVLRPGADPFYGQPALPGWFVDMDPPEHTRLRRLLAGHFTVRRLNELRPRIEQIVEKHLDELEYAQQPADLVDMFALPIPVLTICELLGVPYADRKEFQRNSTTLFSLDASAQEGAAAMHALADYVYGLVRDKRAHPSDDLLSNLASNSDANDSEITGAGVLLLTAGHETVASMLGLGAFAILCNPVQLELLRSDPALIDLAVEELLRYLTIFQFGVPRTPLEDVEVEGQVILAGESVTILLSAANRDPQRFDNPDKLDFTRSARGHLAFGYGVHQCIGQNLARMEMRVGYAALFQRFPTLRLAVAAEEIPLGDDMGFYCVHRLPVAWKPKGED